MGLCLVDMRTPYDIETNVRRVGTKYIAVIGNFVPRCVWPKSPADQFLLLKMHQLAAIILTVS